MLFNNWELSEEATNPNDLESKSMERDVRTLKDPRLGDRFPEFYKRMSPRRARTLVRKNNPDKPFSNPHGVSGLETPLWGIQNWPRIGHCTLFLSLIIKTLS